MKTSSLLVFSMLLSIFTYSQEQYGYNHPYDIVIKESDSMFAVRSGLLWGFINHAEKAVISPQYKSVEPFSEGWALVTDINDNSFFVNKKNQRVLNVDKYDAVGKLCNGLIKVELKDNKGYIDKQGFTQLPIEFSNASDFTLGYAIVSDNKSFGEYFLINTKGDIILPKEYNVKEIYSKDRFLTFNNRTRLYGVVNDNKETIIPSTYSYITYDSKNKQFNAFIENSKKMLIDYKGNILDSLLSSQVINEKGWRAIEKLNKKWGIVNKNNQTILPTEYNYINPEYVNGYIAVQKDGIAYFINQDNQKIDSLTFDKIYPYTSNDRSIKVEKNKKVGLIDTKDFHTLIPIEYDNIASFPTNEKMLLFASKNGYQGLINQQNEVILPFVHTEILNLGFSSKYTNVTQPTAILRLVVDNKFGIIDLAQNKKIVPNTYHFLLPFDANHNLEFMTEDGKKGLISLHNDTILQAKYSNIILNEDYTYTLWSDKKQKLTSKNGREFALSYDLILPIKDAYIVSKNGKYGLIDTSGKEIIPTIYSFWKFIKDNINSTREMKRQEVVAFKLDEKNSNHDAGDIIPDNDLSDNKDRVNIKQIGYTIFTNKGEKILINDAEFEKILDDRFYLINKQSKKGITNKSGTVIIPCKYDYLFPFGNGFIASINNKYGVIDTKNQIIQPFIYNDFGVKDGIDYLLFFKDNGKDFSSREIKQDLLTKNLVFMSNFKYSSFMPKYKNFVALNVSKFGVVDSKLNIIIPFEYDAIDLDDINDNEWFKLKKGDKWLYVNNKNSIMKRID